MKWIGDSVFVIVDDRPQTNTVTFSLCVECGEQPRQKHSVLCEGCAVFLRMMTDYRDPNTI